MIHDYNATLAAMVVWGFLMSFFYTSMMRLISDKKDDFLVFTSFIMFISYFISDHFFDFLSTSKIFLTWFIYDITTLIIIIASGVFFKLKNSIGIKYVYIGLVFNSILFFSMYIDIDIYKNSDAWWLWDLYTTGINISDFIMIIALILDRDYLGIIRFYKFLTSPIRKKALN